MVPRTSHGCSLGAWRTRGLGDDRAGNAERRWRRRLRYKISACSKWLKALRIRQSSCNLRYKISGATNPLF